MTDSRLLLPREPQRVRGKARFELLLDAVDALLKDRDPSAVTIQDVAGLANVPLASVYHYFPSNVALLVGTARRYALHFERLMTAPLVHSDLRSWTDICRIHAREGRTYFTEHPTAMKLLLGADCGWQVRQTDLAANQRIGRVQFETYRHHFVIPDDDSLADRCAIGLTISDSILSLSYARYRTITEDMAEEALQARLAYLRLYLPERAMKRDTPAI